METIDVCGLEFLSRYTSYTKLSPSGSLQVHDNVGVTDTPVALFVGDKRFGFDGGLFVNGAGHPDNKNSINTTRKTKKP